MTKPLDLKKTIYELVQVYPEFIQVMEELGFSSITNPTMLTTVGRVMTLPKGATVRGLDLEKIKQELAKRGYQVE